MTQLPYPGIIKEKQRVNLEAIEHKSPIGIIYFDFNVANYNNAKQIGVVPKNSIIATDIIIRIDERFTGTETELRVYYSNVSNETLIGFASINSVEVVVFGGIPGSYPGFGKKTNIEVPLVITVISRLDNKPTRGSGYGILQYIMLDRI